MVDDDSRLGHKGDLPQISAETDTDTETDIDSTSDAESLSKTDGGARTGTRAEINHSWRLVNFWSEWCAPCRKEIPMLNELHDLLAAHQVAIVGINFDDANRAETLRAANALGIEFPTLRRNEIERLDLRPPDVMPTTYILSPDNSVFAKLIGLQSRDDILGHLAKLGLLGDHF
ncbi:MAG: TlpA disulfide reductase family protein [Cyanobacteria bacterium P01_F01_bin.33]